MSSTGRYRSPLLAPDARAALLEYVAAGGTVGAFARVAGNPTAAQCWRAIADDAELEAAFRMARRIGAEALAEDALAVSRTPSDHPDDVAHRRLQADTLKWLSKAWAPATYGDASRVTHAGDAAAPIVLDDAARAARIAAILASAGQGQQGQRVEASEASGEDGS